MLRARNRHTSLSYESNGSCPRRGPRRPLPVYATLVWSAPSKTAVVEAGGRNAVVDVPDTREQDEARCLRPPAISSSMKPATPVTIAMLNDVKTMFRSLLKEYAYWVDDAWITGTIPRELCGTYYRNGPGLHVTNPRFRRHTLDGDGMVFSIAFKDGQAYFRNRFVRTKGFLEEQAAGRPLHRNSFTRGSPDGSPLFNPFDLSFKNVANTGVLPWGGQLYALWEAGLPYLMDPRTLDTIRETRMAGQIRANTFSAHYHIVTEHNHPPPTATRGTAPIPLPAASAGPQWRHDLGGSQSSPQPPVLPSCPYVGSQHGDLGRPQHHPQPHARLHGPQPRQQGYSPVLPGQTLQREHWDRGPFGSAGEAAATTAATPSRRLITFSNDFGFGGTKATFYEFEESGRLLHETAHTLPGIDIALIHDMLVTEHYYVLLVGPIKLDPLKFATKYMLGSCSIAECLAFDDRQPARVMLFPRPGRPSGKVLSPRVLTADSFFVFHNVNGYEEQDGQVLVLDTVAWDEVSFELGIFDNQEAHPEEFVGGARAQLTRLTCDLRTGTVTRRKLLQRTVEFPATDPRVSSRPHLVAWFVSDTVNDPVLWGPPQSIIRVHLSADADGAGASDAAASPLAPPRPAAAAACGAAAGAAPGVAVDQFYLGERRFPGEPMFAPRPGSTREGDGWLIVGVYDAGMEKSDVLIFDAESLSSGPVATIHLPHRLPFSLHGAWDPNYMGPDPRDAAVPRWQELGSVRPL